MPTSSVNVPDLVGIAGIGILLLAPDWWKVLSVPLLGYFILNSCGPHIPGTPCPTGL
jgi:hypothetical protein